MTRKNIVIYESKSNMGSPIEFTKYKVTVKHEPASSEPIFHLKCNLRGYVPGDHKIKSYYGKIYIPKYEAVIRISDLSVKKYKLFLLLRTRLKETRHPALLKHTSAYDFHNLVEHLNLRVSRRKTSTYWDKLLDAWNELNPGNKPPGYIELNEECEGVLEWPCMGYFNESCEECEYNELWDYAIYVLSHVDDYCPQSARKIFVQYKNRKNGGFAVFFDVTNFKPVKWRFGKAACGGKIPLEHYERIRNILCNIKYGGRYFTMMFEAIEKNGYFNAKKYYGLYERVG